MCDSVKRKDFSTYIFVRNSPSSDEALSRGELEEWISTFSKLAGFRFQDGNDYSYWINAFVKFDDVKTAEMAIKELNSKDSITAGFIQPVFDMYDDMENKFVALCQKESVIAVTPMCELLQPSAMRVVFEKYGEMTSFSYGDVTFIGYKHFSRCLAAELDNNKWCDHSTYLSVTTLKQFKEHLLGFLTILDVCDPCDNMPPLRRNLEYPYVPLPEGPENLPDAFHTNSHGVDFLSAENKIIYDSQDKEISIEKPKLSFEPQKYKIYLLVTPNSSESEEKVNSRCEPKVQSPSFIADNTGSSKLTFSASMHLESAMEEKLQNLRLDAHETFTNVYFNSGNTQVYFDSTDDRPLSHSSPKHRISVDPTQQSCNAFYLLNYPCESENISRSSITDNTSASEITFPTYLHQDSSLKSAGENFQNLLIGDNINISSSNTDCKTDSAQVYYDKAAVPLGSLLHGTAVYPQQQCYGACDPMNYQLSLIHGIPVNTQQHCCSTCDPMNYSQQFFPGTRVKGSLNTIHPTIGKCFDLYAQKRSFLPDVKATGAGISAKSEALGHVKTYNYKRATRKCKTRFTSSPTIRKQRYVSEELKPSLYKFDDENFPTLEASQTIRMQNGRLGKLKVKNMIKLNMFDKDCNLPKNNENKSKSRLNKYSETESTLRIAKKQEHDEGSRKIRKSRYSDNLQTNIIYE